MLQIPRASSTKKIESISTGLPALDRAIGVGGIPKGRIIEISGKWSAGKSTLAYQIVAEAQKEGMETFWYDSEFSHDNPYAESLGVDTDEMYLIQSPTAEEGLDTILDVLRGDKETPAIKNALFVLDSVGGLHPAEEAGKNSGERTIGAQASLIARFCRKAVPLLALNNNTLIVLNHEYLEIGAQRPTVMTSGGAKLSYHKSLWLRLSRTGMNLSQGEKIIGYKAELEIRKNKVADTERTKCNLEMFYGKGFSAVSNLFDEAKEAGVLHEEGRTWYFGEEKIGSISKVREALGKPDFAAKVQHALT